jgi:hypothetical protein
VATASRETVSREAEPPKVAAREADPEEAKITGFVKLGDSPTGGILVGGPHGEVSWLDSGEAARYDLGEPGTATVDFPDDDSAPIFEGEPVHRYISDSEGATGFHAIRHSRFGWVVVAEGKPAATRKEEDEPEGVPKR